MTVSERWVVSGLALGLGLVGLLLDLTGWYALVGAVFGALGYVFVLFMPRGKLRRSALWLNLAAVAVAAVILVSLLT